MWQFCPGWYSSMPSMLDEIAQPKAAGTYGKMCVSVTPRMYGLNWPTPASGRKTFLKSKEKQKSRWLLSPGQEARTKDADMNEMVHFARSGLRCTGGAVYQDSGKRPCKLAGVRYKIGMEVGRLRSETLLLFPRLGGFSRAGTLPVRTRRLANFCLKEIFNKIMNLKIKILKEKTGAIYLLESGVDLRHRIRTSYMQFRAMNLEGGKNEQNFR